MRQATFLGVATLTWLVAAQGMAGAQTPISATLRCPHTAECIDDAIGADSLPDGAFDFLGFHTASQSKTGKTIYYIYDGAYLNTQGGIDINLVSEPTAPTDSALVFQLGAPLGSTTLPAICIPVAGLASKDVDFRFNVFENGSPVGIDKLLPNTSINGETGNQIVGGVVNFAMAPGVSGALFFNHSAAWDGTDLTLSRSLDGNTYTLEADSDVSFTCYDRRKGSRNYAGTFHVPFQLTVVVPPPPQ